MAKHEENLCAIEQEKFGEHLYVGELLAFEERSFGTVVKPGEKLIKPVLMFIEICHALLSLLLCLMVIVLFAYAFL